MKGLETKKHLVPAGPPFQIPTTEAKMNLRDVELFLPLLHQETPDPLEGINRALAFIDRHNKGKVPARFNADDIEVALAEVRTLTEQAFHKCEIWSETGAILFLFVDCGAQVCCYFMDRFVPEDEDGEGDSENKGNPFQATHPDEPSKLFERLDEIVKKSKKDGEAGYLLKLSAFGLLMARTLASLDTSIACRIKRKVSVHYGFFDSGQFFHLGDLSSKGFTPDPELRSSK